MCLAIPQAKPGEDTQYAQVALHPKQSESAVEIVSVSLAFFHVPGDHGSLDIRRDIAPGILQDRTRDDQAGRLESQATRPGQCRRAPVATIDFQRDNHAKS
mgnify:CR=1 FL=1